MAAADGLKAMSGKRVGEFRFMEDGSQVLLHFFAGAGDQEIGARSEKVLGIVPIRRDEGNAAGEGFERANGGNAGKQFDVRPARDMNSNAAAGKGDGCIEVGQPSGICEARGGQGGFRGFRIAHAVDTAAKSKSVAGLDEKFMKFGTALAVAPVSDPDEIVLRLVRRTRKENAWVGRLVPCPGASGPAVLEVKLAQNHGARCRR